MRPKRVIFELTASCPVGCRHCYNSAFAGFNGRNSGVDVEQALRTLDVIIAHFDTYFHRTHFTLHGGEPLLYGPQELEAVLERVMPHVKTVGIQTSLVPLQPGHLEVIRRWPDRIVVSTSYDFDGGRGRPVREADFLRQLDLTREALGGRNLNAIICLSQLNLAEVERGARVLHEHGLDRFKLAFLSHVDYALSHLGRDRVFNLLERHIAPVFAWAVRNGIRLSPLDSYIKFLLTGHHLDCARDICHGSESFIAVSANGDVHLCGRLKEEKDFCGNLHEDGVRVAVSRYAMRRRALLREALFALRHPECHACCMRDFCGEGCEGDKDEQGRPSVVHCALTLFVGKFLSLNDQYGISEDELARFVAAVRTDLDRLYRLHA